MELKPKWTKYCVLSAGGAYNANDNSNNIIFTTKDTKLWMAMLRHLKLKMEKKIKTINCLSFHIDDEKLLKM